MPLRPLRRPGWNLAARRCFSTSASSSSPSFSSPSSSSSSSPAALPPIHVLRLDQLRLPICSQLQIEEALLRSTRDPRVGGKSFFLLNHPPREEKSIVMGLSNKTELLVHLDHVQRDQIQLVRRFSGGGTVFVDKNCWMVTMLVQKHPSASTDAASQATSPAAAAASTVPPSLPVLPQGLTHPSSLPAYPNLLMEWTRDFYAPVFDPPVQSTLLANAAHDRASPSPAPAPAFPPLFSLTGHDYCFSHRKFGGNAQTITRDRWLHHTSFLWKLDSLGQIEKYLQVPKKQPEYRKGRSHTEFLTSLREVWNEVEQGRRSAEGGNDPTAQELAKFEQRNPPSSHPLFRTPDGSSPFSSEQEDVSIPSSLPSRLLHRLSQFYTLHYPPLDEVADIVSSYHREATSSVKILDYEEERARAQRDAALAEEKARLAKEKEEAEAAAATASANAAS